MDFWGWVALVSAVLWALGILNTLHEIATTASRSRDCLEDLRRELKDHRESVEGSLFKIESALADLAPPKHRDSADF